MKPGITIRIEAELDETWIDHETAAELTDDEIIEMVAEDWFELIQDASEQERIFVVRATAAEEATE